MPTGTTAWVADRDSGSLILLRQGLTSSARSGAQTKSPGSAAPALVALLLIAVTACSAGDATSQSTEPTATRPSFPVLGESVEQAPLPELDPDAVLRGELLYSANCASCHGASGEGDPNWQTPNQDGSYPPPPQDVNGHTWHHADQLLVDIILNGSDFPESRMPPFAGTLTEADVTDILEYFKSTWGPTERDVNWQATQRVLAEQQ